MRQLSRWYNIEVTYQGETSNKVFYAGISRQRNISAVLSSAPSAAVDHPVVRHINQ